MLYEEEDNSSEAKALNGLDSLVLLIDEHVDSLCLPSSSKGEAGWQAIILAQFPCHFFLYRVVHAVIASLGGETLDLFLNESCSPVNIIKSREFARPH